MSVGYLMKIKGVEGDYMPLFIASARSLQQHRESYFLSLSTVLLHQGNDGCPSTIDALLHVPLTMIFTPLLVVNFIGQKG